MIDSAGTDLLKRKTMISGRKRGLSQMKRSSKDSLSGVMAVATLASVIVQPVAVSASELEPEEIPFGTAVSGIKDVQNSPLIQMKLWQQMTLNSAYGQEFEVKVDLSGIEGVDETK